MIQEQLRRQFKTNLACKTRKDTGKSKMSPRDMRNLAQVAKVPLHSSKVNFDAAGIKKCCRWTRCIILNKLETVVKPKARSLISQNNRLKRVT